eukprot:TRINITY_DN2808_c0_g1_i1.p1 TRINITY_DN2808_c0_g1~~TRINITY_DN2808_c0_g1_i1.p1  ORF type:complete len:444 (+),score=125.48 TRINITY_DN2808_c0_g1_i1:218-1549(+)
MASTENLVPITRAFLAKFYDKFPMDPIKQEVADLQKNMVEKFEIMEGQLPKPEGEEEFVSPLSELFDPPHKIDENLWKNREQIEEMLYLLDKEHWPSTLAAGEVEGAKIVTASIETWKTELQKMLEIILTYQQATGEKVFTMVATYLPQDFRGTLIKQQRERSEKRRQLEVENLINSGGTIKQKYALLWQQQMDRRKTLASLGSASGVFKTLVQLLVGVPQVLLEFVKTINDHNGPMEEQRERYGPALYEMTAFGNRLRVFLVLWWTTFDQHLDDAEKYTQVVDAAVKIYLSEFSRFLDVLKQVFENSPFLISSEEAMSSEEKSKLEEFSEVTIANGCMHEVPLAVECEGSLVAWDFKLSLGKDVGFSVEYINSDGAKLGMLPYQRIDMHQGSFNAPGAGSYVLSWDNTYSILTKKTVKYKVDVIPPVVSAEEVKVEEALSQP